MNFSKIKEIPYFNSYKFEHLQQTESTNDNLKSYLQQDFELKILQTADHQTKGRGQHGRSWESEPGQCLMFSYTALYEQIKFPPSMVAGIAMISALYKHGGENAGLWLKWPNDIWMDRRKISGILTESTVKNDRINCIIGIGINILPLKRAVEKITTSSEDLTLSTASVSEFWQDPDPNILLNDFCLEWNRLSSLKDEKLEMLWKYYGQEFLLHRYHVKTSTDEFYGVPKGIESDGSVLIKPDKGNLRLINAATLTPIF